MNPARLPIPPLRPGRSPTGPTHPPSRGLRRDLGANHDVAVHREVGDRGGVGVVGERLRPHEPAQLRSTKGHNQPPGIFASPRDDRETIDDIISIDVAWDLRERRKIGGQPVGPGRRWEGRFA